jgi:cell pole-organizing protein PopZ
MSGKAEQEPSIEEILASIRQIISDDDEPARDAAVDLSAKDEPARTSDLTLKNDAPAESSFADVLELTSPIEDDRKSDLDLSAAEDKYSIPSSPQPHPSPSSFANVDLDLSVHEEKGRDSNLDLSQSDDSIFSTVAATATTQAFTKLMGNIPVERDENKTLYADGRITLEDIVKDMLRPMLREWINDHVPTIVERLVEKELEKLSRHVRD